MKMWIVDVRYGDYFLFETQEQAFVACCKYTKKCTDIDDYKSILAELTESYIDDNDGFYCDEFIYCWSIEVGKEITD